MEHIYLDNAATTKVSLSVGERMLEAMQLQYGNPSSLHRMGFEAQLLVDKSRQILADILGCTSGEIVFTPSGSYANNLAVLGAVGRRPVPVAATAVEHTSLLEPIKMLEQKGWPVTWILPDCTGGFSPESLVSQIPPDTRLVSFMAVNSETGVRIDIAGMTAAIRRKAPKALIHCDAVQAFGRYALHPQKLGLDLMSISAHKINGPKGVAALYVRGGVNLARIVFGSSQERGLTPGTENVPGIVGFGAAAKNMWDDRLFLMEHFHALNQHLRDGLANFPDVHIHSPDDGAPYILNLSLPGLKSEVVIHFLEERGIYLSSGSACSKGKRSHVLAAMDVPNRLIDSALRISFGRYNTLEDVSTLLTALEEAQKTLARTKQ